MKDELIALYRENKRLKSENERLKQVIDSLNGKQEDLKQTAKARSNTSFSMAFLRVV